MSSGHLLPGIADQFRIAYERNCLALLICGYKKLLHSRIVDLSWEEEKITMELARCMKHCNEEKNWRIHIVAEPRLYADEFYATAGIPKEAPKIDLQLLNWSSPYELIYNIEAKNLAENDWTKSTGANVSSSFLTARYIDTGIENFINDRYVNGCLAGYVLNGEPNNVVVNLNGLLGKRKRAFENLNLTSPVEGYSFCYQSLHQKSARGNDFIIPHVLLKFT
jgi:hypothetical protein